MLFLKECFLDNFKRTFHTEQEMCWWAGQHRNTKQTWSVQHAYEHFKMHLSWISLGIWPMSFGPSCLILCNIMFKHLTATVCPSCVTIPSVTNHCFLLPSLASNRGAQEVTITATESQYCFDGLTPDTLYNATVYTQTPNDEGPGVSVKERTCESPTHSKFKHTALFTVYWCLDFFSVQWWSQP